MRWTLSVKIALGIAAILIAAMSASVILNVILIRNQLMADSRHYAIHLSEVAEAGLENAMIIKDPEKIKSIMQSIGGSADIVGAAIFNKRGEIKYSITPGDVGRTFSKNDPMCIICHGGTLSDQTQTVILSSKQDARILKVARPIINQPHCQGCHQERLLGMLMVDISLAEVDQQATAILRQQIRQSLATVVIVIIALMGFMYLIVTRPLAHFVRITRAIDNGDLDKRVNLTHKDEIGELGDSFDRMVESIAARTQELKTLNEIAATQITERKRAEEGERRNREEAERLAEETAVIANIGRVIGSTPAIDEVYERFAVEAGKLIPFDRVSVNLINPDGKSFAIAYISGFDVPNRRPGTIIPIAGSVTEVFMQRRSGRIIHVESPEDLVRQFPSVAVSSVVLAGIRSLIGVPLIHRNELIGSLHFRSKKQNAYTERDLLLAEWIGMQIIGAIANAQLFTSLKNTENSLRESESRFRGLVEQAAVGVAEFDMNTGRFLTVNRRLCEIAGRTEEELLNTTSQAITCPEDVHLHQGKTQMMLAGKIGHYSLEKRYLRKDGGIVWVNVTVSPLWKPGEAPGRNIAVIEDITERRLAEEKIKQMVYHDSLTGLPNRKLFSDRLGIALAQAWRNQKEVGIAMLDLDNFKGVNDTHGHDAGDLLLKATAERLSVALRKGDTIARFGGDEFVLILPDPGVTKDAIQVAQKIVDSFREPFLIDTHQFVVTTSIGIAVYPSDGMDEGTLLKNADIAMYQAKQAGRARYQLFKKS